MSTAVKSGNIFLFTSSTRLFHFPVSAPNSLSAHLPSRQKAYLSHGDERRIDVSKHATNYTPRSSPDAPNVNPAINMQPHDVLSSRPRLCPRNLWPHPSALGDTAELPDGLADAHTPPSSRSKLGPGHAWGKGGDQREKKTGALPCVRCGHTDRDPRPDLRVFHILVREADGERRETVRACLSAEAASTCRRQHRATGSPRGQTPQPRGTVGS
jgi:hypothetical protein